MSISPCLWISSVLVAKVDNKAMYIPVSLFSGWTEGTKTVKVKALLDCGTGDTFIDHAFVKSCQIPITRLKKPVKVFKWTVPRTKKEKLRTSLNSKPT
jgi:hypothetical protein